MQDKIINSLSLAKRAGALVMGFDAVKESVYKGKAHLVLYTSDMSEKNIQRVENFCEELVDTIKLPHTKEDMIVITRKPTAVFTVTDENLAILCKKALAEKEQSGLQSVIEEDKE